MMGLTERVIIAEPNFAHFGTLLRMARPKMSAARACHDDRLSAYNDTRATR